MASDVGAEKWVVFQPQTNVSGWVLLKFMDVPVVITHRYYRVGKKVDKDGKYRYFIEQGDEGERTYGEWHDKE